MRVAPAEGQVDEDIHQAATSDDRKQVERILEAWADLVAEMDLSFNGQVPQEAERPLATTQLRYFRSMRAIGTFLKATGQARLQFPFYELAEAFYSISQGHRCRIFEIDESAKPRPSQPQNPEELRRGRRPDGPNIWRLRANLCAGIRWLMAGGKSQQEAINAVVKDHHKSLVKIQRSGTRDLAKAIEAWLTRLENPVPSDDSVAVALFQDEIAHLKALRVNLSQAELTSMGKGLIKGTALRASKLL
jgi:hypothetical protein